MIKSKLEKEENISLFTLPSQLLDKCLSKEKLIKQTLISWVKSNNLSLEVKENNLIGSEIDIEKAKELISNKETRPIIPYKAIKISNKIPIKIVKQNFQRINRSKTIKWYLNIGARNLFVPDLEDQTISKKDQEFIDSLTINIDDINSNEESDIDNIIGDYKYHEDPNYLSHDFINIYLEDGSLIQRHFCIKCLKSMLKFSLKNMYDQNNDSINIIEVHNNMDYISPISLLECEQKEGTEEYFPIIPIGQMLWAIVKEPEIANRARTWLTAIAISSFHYSPHFVKCPDHPQMLEVAPHGIQNEDFFCLAPGCNKCLCSICHKWHQIGDCPEDPGIPPGCRECPYCHNCIEKTCACNHLACRCGNDFCYYCGEGLSGGHSISEHGDIYNHPPDLRKFCMHQDVPDSELIAFYKQYPKWKPRNFKM